MQCNMTSKLKALGGCSGHHFQGWGAYCVGPTTGHTACLDLLSECYSYCVLQPLDYHHHPHEEKVNHYWLC